jgi:transposase
MSKAVEGSTTREVFEAYLERVLTPSLRVGGRLVVMDDLSSHKGSRVRELIEERGCELIYLPPYSPDFKPIEEAFAKLSRRTAAESRGTYFLRGTRRGDGSSSRGAESERCSWLLRAPWLPREGPSAMTDALEPLYECDLEGSPAFIAVRKPAYLSRFLHGRTPLSFPVSAGTGLLAVLQ